MHRQQGCSVTRQNKDPSSEVFSIKIQDSRPHSVQSTHKSKSLALGLENAGVHELDVAHDRGKIHERQDVLLDVDARRHFHQLQGLAVLCGGWGWSWGGLRN